MAFAGMNYLAILVAAVAAFAWGAAYYMTLSKQWLAAVGRTERRRREQSIAGALHHLVRGAARHGLGAGRLRSAISGPAR